MDNRDLPPGYRYYGKGKWGRGYGFVDHLGDRHRVGIYKTHKTREMFDVLHVQRDAAWEHYEKPLPTEETTP